MKIQLTLPGGTVVVGGTLVDGTVTGGTVIVIDGKQVN